MNRSMVSKNLKAKKLAMKEIKDRENLSCSGFMYIPPQNTSMPMSYYKTYAQLVKSVVAVK